MTQHLPGGDDEILRRAQARVGRTLREKWRLDALLGVGGMAAVYAASHRNGNRVAVKWLHPELAVDRKMRERFALEGYIANRVNHPGVVRVIDDEVADDGGLVLFMELLEGETVDARWERDGRSLSALDALRVGHSLLDVLDAAHGAGIVHRDLKPENLFLTRRGELKVLDFGIARLRELSSPTATSSQSSLGTPAFMPPEQARGRWQDVDARTDIWAVGATLFTLITGRFVHLAETVNEQLLAAMTQPAPALLSIAPGTPVEIAQIVDRALAFDQNLRFPTAAAMRAACAEVFRRFGANPALEPVGSSPELVTTTMPERRPMAATTGRPVAHSSRIPPVKADSFARLPYALMGLFAAVALFLGGMAFRQRMAGPPHDPSAVTAPPSVATELPPTPALVTTVIAPAPVEAPASAPAPSAASSEKPPAPVRRPAPQPRPARPAAPAADWHDRRQ